MSLNVTLVVVGGDVKTPEVKLRLPSTVGRGRDCSIMLRHPLVSRQHCEIFEAGGALLVRDLGSLNGTFVNNQRIEGDAPLHPGQLLTIGTVTFRAMYDAAATDSGPPPTPPPQIKRDKEPSSDTDAEGVVPVRPKTSDPTVRNVSADASSETEPVDVEVDFDMDDAKPLFSEAPEPKTSLDARKNGAPEKPGTEKGATETVYAPKGGKPAPPPAANPAKTVPAKSAPAKPAATKPEDKPAAKPEAPAPGFNFLEAEEAAAQAEDEDDDLNDFLKNLK